MYLRCIPWLSRHLHSLFLLCFSGSPLPLGMVSLAQAIIHGVLAPAFLPSLVSRHGSHASVMWEYSVLLSSLASCSTCKNQPPHRSAPLVKSHFTLTHTHPIHSPLVLKSLHDFFYDNCPKAFPLFFLPTLQLEHNNMAMAVMEVMFCESFNLES